MSDLSQAAPAFVQMALCIVGRQGKISLAEYLTLRYTD